jgi:antitoxin component YwqK of YwqJK toxin-antitoxin module
MSLGKIEKLSEYKQVCEYIHPVYADIIFSYLIEIRKEYYESGEIKREIPYINDKIHGIKKEYYSHLKRVEERLIPYGDYKIYSEIPYINGKRDGIMKGYYISSEIKEEIPYINIERTK